MQASTIKTNIWNMYIVEVKTVHFRYIAVMYNTTSNKTHKRKVNYNQTINPQKASHTSPIVGIFLILGVR